MFNEDITMIDHQLLSWLRMWRIVKSFRCRLLS